MAIDANPRRQPYKSMSRAAMTTWFVPWIGVRKTLAELSDAVVYVHLLAHLFPSSVDKKKLKTLVKNDLDKTHNWMVFQRGLVRVNVDKNIDLVHLIKPASVAGFDFCRWFIAFFEANQHVLEVAAPPPPLADDPPSTWRVDTPARRTREADFIVPKLEEIAEEVEDEPRLVVKWEIEKNEPEEPPVVEAAPLPAALWQEEEVKEEELEERTEERMEEGQQTPKDKKKKRLEPFTMVLRSADKRK